MRIEPLGDHPDLVPTVARWNRDWWGWPLEGCVELAGKCADPNPIPTLYVALVGKEPVGEVTLIAHDMDVHRDLSPWLSALFVLPVHRRKGIGSALVRYLEGQAKRMGVPRLYLYTAEAEPFYARLGWITIGRDDYEGKAVALMSTDLTG